MAKKMIKIKQVKSVIGCSKRQKRTIEALGLGRINKEIEKEATPQVLGMVNKVRHIIEVVK